MSDSTAQEPHITRELVAPPVAGPPLDPSLFRPNKVEREFLLRAISPDEAQMERSVRQIQKEYVSATSLHLV